MKKWISIIVGIICVMLLYFGIDAKMQQKQAISIIGGADGPTSIFIAGKIGYGSIFLVITIGVILVVGVIWWIKRRK